jgi:hypothetical protein
MAHIIEGRPRVASDNEEMVRNEFIRKILGEPNLRVNSNARV